MAKKHTIQGVKGMEDILPADAAYYQFIEAAARAVFALYGYSEIRTPILEPTELFSRSVGDSSDIVVSKQMYTFTDPGERSNTMRPEGTAGVVRAVVEHGLLKENPTRKLWYSGQMFRYEKPQKGRLRQFNQLGLEAFGYTHPAADAEIIAMVCRVLARIGFANIVVKLNNLGDKQDRATYNEALRAALAESMTAAPWCDQCKTRALLNPMRVFDCKEPRCQELATTLPRIEQFINPEAKAHFATVTSLLDICNIAWTLDENLVRGLDYYCRTVFEFTQEGTGAQSAVGGGGRYDGLVEELGGPTSPGVGVGLGVERLIIAMKAQGIMPAETAQPELFIAALDEVAIPAVFALTEKARAAQIPVAFDLQPKSLKATLKSANRINAKTCVFVGPTEVEQQRVIWKNLTTGEQESLTFSQTEERLLNFR